MTPFDCFIAGDGQAGAAKLPTKHGANYSPHSMDGALRSRIILLSEGHRRGVSACFVV